MAFPGHTAGSEPGFKKQSISDMYQFVNLKITECEITGLARVA